mgnify:CR=1 FL=1
MGLQDDRMSGNIQDIARLITRLLLKGDMPQYTLPAAEADYTEADRLFKKVIGLADEGDINGAENARDGGLCPPGDGRGRRGVADR